MNKAKAYEMIGVNPIHLSDGRIISPDTPQARRFEHAFEPAMERFMLEIQAIRPILEPTPAALKKAEKE